jgi:hypothetical protein
MPGIIGCPGRCAAGGDWLRFHPSFARRFIPRDKHFGLGQEPGKP